MDYCKVFGDRTSSAYLLRDGGSGKGRKMLHLVPGFSSSLTMGKANTGGRINAKKTVFDEMESDWDPAGLLVDPSCFFDCCHGSLCGEQPYGYDSHELPEPAGF